MQTPEDYVNDMISGKLQLSFIDAIAARDAEWQARVDTLLEDNARSEEQVKKQFANAVSFKARAEKAEARVEKLEAVLKECGRKLDEALAAEDWGEVKSVWCDIDAALRKAGEIPGEVGG